MNKTNFIVQFCEQSIGSLPDLCYYCIFTKSKSSIHLVPIFSNSYFFLFQEHIIVHLSFMCHPCKQVIIPLYCGPRLAITYAIKFFTWRLWRNFCFFLNAELLTRVNFDYNLIFDNLFSFFSWSIDQTEIFFSKTDEKQQRRVWLSRDLCIDANCFLWLH